MIRCIIILFNCCRQPEITAVFIGGQVREPEYPSWICPRPAFMHGRDYVVPQDIQQVFIDTIAHRMLMQPTHTADAAAAGEALQEILQQIQPPHTRRKGL